MEKKFLRKIKIKYHNIFYNVYEVDFETIDIRKNFVSDSRKKFIGPTKKDADTYENISWNNKNNNKEINNTLSQDDEKKYGMFDNVRLDGFWLDRLHLESEKADEYIERLDSFIEENDLHDISSTWSVKKFGIKILDWMRRDGVIA